MHESVWRGHHHITASPCTAENLDWPVRGDEKQSYDTELGRWSQYRIRLGGYADAMEKVREVVLMNILSLI